MGGRGDAVRATSTASAEPVRRSCNCLSSRHVSESQRSPGGAAREARRGGEGRRLTHAPQASPARWGEPAAVRMARWGQDDEQRTVSKYACPMGLAAPRYSGQGRGGTNPGRSRPNARLRVGE